MRRITGQKDPIIRLLRELQTEDGRRRNGRFLAEGEELVRRAFDYGGTVHSVIFTDRYAAAPAAQALLEKAACAGAEACQCSEGLIAKILDAKPTPECLAIVERKVASPADVFAGSLPLVQMVENCENADNLGMLLRSTDAAGVTGVILAGNTADPFQRRVVRGSRGAVFTVPICVQYDAAKAIDEARKHNVQIIATSANADTIYTEVDYSKPTMVVVGSERTGISDTVGERADAVVRIPMLGRINSLNIAVAAGVVMFEAIRQRG